ncbi:transglutaminase domain-containing protein [Pseudothermotoga sp.]|nr:transglutaminase-like domain-containing protein [Pseudothermotoga sp.]MDW8140171.1 transglutaminase domain-containing protein [Pseudothermotoga sp.]
MKRFVFVILLALMLTTVFSIQMTKINTIKIYAEGTIDEKGDMDMNLKWMFPTSALYIQVKSAYPNPYVLLRNMTTFSSIFEMRDTTVSYDDAKNSITARAKLIGAVANRRQRCEFFLGRNAEMIYTDSKTQAIFVLVQSASSEEVIFTIFTLKLPKDSSDFKYDSSTGIFSFVQKRKNFSGNVSAEVNVKVKPRIMSALYKVYGMSDVANGAYWVAKTIFTNKGKGDVVDLRISYKLGDYTSWSPENVYDVVPPSGSVVDLYYPIISSNVTQLRSQTPIDLQVKYTYKDRSGKSYSDTITKRIQILGVNQFEFSNVPEEERTGAWADNFSNVPLIAAFVTHLDEPVKAFAGMVSQHAGGVAAASRDSDAETFCRALYELLIHNKVSYQTPSGFLVEYASSGQDIKFPRDVLKDKAGTCIDLAILFAAVCRAVDLKTYIVVVPGHAFPVVELPSGDILPIESTGIGGPVVGKSLPFNEAVEAGARNLSKLEFGKFFVVDPIELQRVGVLSPELPSLPSTILKDWGYSLPQRTQQTQPTQQVQQRPSGSTPTNPSPAPAPTPQPQRSVNISGYFVGNYRNSITGQQGKLEFYIEQSGNNIKGDVHVDESDEGEFTGTVSGNSVKITAKIESYYYSTTYTVVFNGTIQGNTISGNYSIPGSNVTGTFTVKKSE